MPVANPRGVVALPVHLICTAFIEMRAHRHRLAHTLGRMDTDCRACQALHWKAVTGLFLSNENTIRPAVDLLVLVLREASRDRR